MPADRFDLDPDLDLPADKFNLDPDLPTNELDLCS